MDDSCSCCAQHGLALFSMSQSSLASAVHVHTRPTRQLYTCRDTAATCCFTLHKQQAHQYRNCWAHLCVTTRHPSAGSTHTTHTTHACSQLNCHLCTMHSTTRLVHFSAQSPKNMLQHKKIVQHPTKQRNNWKARPTQIRQQTRHNDHLPHAMLPNSQCPVLFATDPTL